MTNPPSSLKLEPNPFEKSFATERKDSTKSLTNSTEAKPSPPAIQPSSNNFTPGGSRKLPLPMSPGGELSPSLFNMFPNQFGKPGFTPNESGMRNGLNSPGILSGFGFSPNPSSMLTPNLISMLDYGKSEEKKLDAKPVKPAEPAKVAIAKEALKEVKKPAARKNTRKEAPKRALASPTGNSSKKQKKDMTKEEKKQSFLERNRLAASKCRQRKKQQIEKMKEDLQFYSEGYDTLKRDNDILKDQINSIHSLLASKKSQLIDSVGFEYVNQLMALTGASTIITQPVMNGAVIPTGANVQSATPIVRNGTLSNVPNGSFHSQAIPAQNVASQNAASHNMAPQAGSGPPIPQQSMVNNNRGFIQSHNLISGMLPLNSKW